MKTRLRPRINISLKVVSEIDRDLEQGIVLVSGDRFEAKAFDISEGGIGIFVKYFFPKGLIIQLELERRPFGLKSPMKLNGEICYCNYNRKSRTYKCGVEFLNITKQGKKAIARFISTYEKRKQSRIKLPE
jgi:c-di-GMP-binding flagellar brake protein YcgR